MGKNTGKNISKNVSGKYSQKVLEYVKQSATDSLKTVWKRAIQNNNSQIEKLNLKLQC